MKNFTYYLTIFLLSSLLSSEAFAGEIGTLVNVVGKVSLLKLDGTSTSAKPKDKLNEGDTIESENGSFAKIVYIDGGEMVLRPGTQVKLTQYKFSQDNPAGYKSEVNKEIKEIAEPTSEGRL